MLVVSALNVASSALDWLNAGANLLTLLLGLAVVIGFVISRLTIVWIVRHFYLRRLSPALDTPRRYLGPSLAERISKRVRGERWAPVDEYRLLASAKRSAHPWIPWNRELPLDRLGNAYEKTAGDVRRSFVLRAGSGAAFIEQEARFAQSIGDCLKLDADFQLASALGHCPSRSLEQLMKEEFGARMLLWPPSGLSSYYNDVRCTMTGEHFGVPSDSFSALSAAGPPTKGRWPGCDIAPRLDKRVQSIAQARVAGRGKDFDGELLRLRRWRAENSESSGATRLHLLADTTNFASVLATNGGLHIETVDDCRHEIDAMLLDRLLDTPQDDDEHLVQGERSYAANHIVVHLSILTADRLLLFARRSMESEFYPGALNSAVNGVIEVSGRHGLAHGDFDEFGFVDVVIGALREQKEELGDLGLCRDDVVVRALGCNRTPQEVTPYVLLEARTSLTISEIAERQFTTASRHEGAFEVGEEFVGLPVSCGSAEGIVGWLRERRTDLTPGAFVGAILVAGYHLSAEEIVDAWASARPLDPASAVCVPLM